MKINMLELPKEGGSPWVSIHDPGYESERRLYIEDGEGNTVVLKNEEIGRLYEFIKPPLAG